MKAIKISTILIAASLLVLGCNDQTATHKENSHASQENHHSETQKENSHTSHEIHHSETAKIRLNNGEKWMVNEEMKPFVIESEEILVQFMESESRDYQQLAAQLEAKNSGLIKSCTMKGESHDELHKWLHPHIDLIKELKQEEKLDKAKSLVQELNKSFKTYHQYFQ